MSATSRMAVKRPPDRVGRLKPRPDTPIEGLWLVGADAGARGIGTEMAADSALRLSERLLAA